VRRNDFEASQSFTLGSAVPIEITREFKFLSVNLLDPPQKRAQVTTRLLTRQCFQTKTISYV